MVLSRGVTTITSSGCSYPARVIGQTKLAIGSNGGTVSAPSTGSLRLVLCDSYQILGQALAAVLQARGHQVLSVTTDPAAGVAAVATYDPDICILDVHFPGQGSGLKAAGLVRRHHPGTKVLLLSSVADAQTLSEAVNAGVAGLIPKDQGIDDIADALQVIAAGGAVFGRGLPHRVLSPGMAKPQFDDPLDALAPREKEVLARIVEGQSTKQMACAMSISNGTVRMYVRNVLTTLGAHSRLEVAAIARREGMLNRLQAGRANLTQAG
jgi:two-component system nitrate/nitrite response regulator NarL